MAGAGVPASIADRAAIVAALQVLCALPECARGALNAAASNPGRKPPLVMSLRGGSGNAATTPHLSHSLMPACVKERCRFFRDKRDTHLSDSVIPVLTLTPRNSPSLTPVCDVNRGRRRVTLTGPVGVCQRVFCGAPARWIEPQQAAQEAQQRGAASGCQSAWQRVGVWVVGRAPPLHRGPVRQPLRP